MEINLAELISIKVLGAGPGKTNQPFIQLGYEVGAKYQALVAPGLSYSRWGKSMMLLCCSYINGYH